MNIEFAISYPGSKMGWEGIKLSHTFMLGNGAKYFMEKIYDYDLPLILVLEDFQKKVQKYKEQNL